MSRPRNDIQGKAEEVWTKADGSGELSTSRHHGHQVEERAHHLMAEELLQVVVLILVMFDHIMNPLSKSSMRESIYQSVLCDSAGTGV